MHATKQILDQWGQDGWELVQVVPGPSGEQLVAYLKRPIGGRRMTHARRSASPSSASSCRRWCRRSPCTCRRSGPATTSTPPASCRWSPARSSRTGKVGAEVDADTAKDLARTCALNAIAAVKSVVGELSAVTRVVKVVGFVASAPDFTGQPQVINGASELLGEVFGDAGRHARSAVGVAVLPLDAPVEVEIIVEVG